MINAATNFLGVDPGLGRDLAGERIATPVLTKWFSQANPWRACPARGIRVEDGIGDLVESVRVPLGHGFGREQVNCLTIYGIPGGREEARSIPRDRRGRSGDKSSLTLMSAGAGAGKYVNPAARPR